MATFQKRSGSWRAIIRKKGHNSSQTFDTKGEAKCWAREVEADLDKKAKLSGNRNSELTLEDALHRYAEEVLPRLRGGQKDKSKVKIILGHQISNLPLTRISKRDVEEFRDFRLKVVSNATVSKEMGIISRVFNTAIQEWQMEYLNNPVKNVRKPKAPPGRARRLRLDETEWILKNTGSFFLEDVLRFAIDAGMRQSEIATLTWDRVDLKKGIVYLEKTKNGEPRSVPLSRKGLDILQNLAGPKIGRVWDITSHAISVAFRRARNRARIAYEQHCVTTGERPDPSFLTNLKFNDLRYEATSKLLEDGVDPMKVAMMTGRKEIRSLSRYGIEKVDVEKLAQRRQHREFQINNDTT